MDDVRGARRREGACRGDLLNRAKGQCGVVIEHSAQRVAAVLIRMDALVLWCVEKPDRSTAIDEFVFVEKAAQSDRYGGVLHHLQCIRQCRRDFAEVRSYRSS